VRSGGRLVVASYNVHRCIGSDGRHDPDRIAAVLAELEADVVGLQEVDSRPESEGGIDQLAYLARASGFARLRGTTVVRSRSGGHYGNALLTRLQVRQARLHDLSLAPREPRGAIDAELSFGALRVRVIVTHFGLRPEERRGQCERLLARLRPPHAAPLCVLLGDFNDWWAPARGVEPLDAHFGPAPPVRTFPARAPLVALDRIWVQPGDLLRSVRAHRTPLARSASDHLPVRGVIDLEGLLAADGDEPS
jgi:endonuclease/exonuclease/phosphatase family metal-dependent hydrolase